MGDGKGRGVSRFAGAGAAAAIFLALVFYGCSTGRIAVDGWGDAGLAAEQRLTIEQQRSYIGELELAIQRGAGNLREAEGRLGSLEGGNRSLEGWLRRVDEFVRAAIAVQRELEGVQRPDSGEDAGAR